MNASLTTEMLDLGAGTVLVCAVVALWRRDLHAIISVLALQGVALGVVAGSLALHNHDSALLAVAGLVVGAKAIVVPLLIRQIVSRDDHVRESDPLVNVPASLVSAAVLVAAAYLVSAKVVAVFPTPVTRLLPLGLAAVLVGFSLLVTRRTAVSQIVGLLLIDNGIALVAFILTSGVPLLLELGASLDILLVVVVLRMLAVITRAKLGPVDLGRLQELRD